MNMSDKPAPAALECQSEIDKDLVRAYYGDIEAFYRVRAALAATPIDALAHSEANCRGLRQRAEAAETKLAALSATPAVRRPVWLRRERDHVVVLVQVDGNWIEVIRERFDGAFSHIWEDNS